MKEKNKILSGIITYVILNACPKQGLRVMKDINNYHYILRQAQNDKNKISIL